MDYLEAKYGLKPPAIMESNGSGTVADPFVPVMDVFVQDQWTRIVDLLLMAPLSEATLTADITLDDRTATFDSLVAPVAGDWLCLKQDNRATQSLILAVVDNLLDNYTVTVDSPIDYAYTAAGHETCGFGSTSLNVNGSVTPVSFYISPPVDTMWDITRILLNMSDIASGDEATFGGQNALTNGIVLRVVHSEDTNNIFNSKTNGMFSLRNFDMVYTAADKFGVYGFKTRRTFNGQDKNGVTARLLGPDDKIEIIIQDDLTGLSEFKICAQGHVVE